MNFETNRDVLEWYEKQPRHLTDEFVGKVKLSESNYTIAALFGGEGGMRWIDRNVSEKLQTLSGFAGITRVSDKIGEIVAQHQTAV